MYLKFSKDEITWIDSKYLTKEVAQDIAGFWVDSYSDKLCCARYNDDKSISHYWFSDEDNEWKLLKNL